MRLPFTAFFHYLVPFLLFVLHVSSKNWTSGRNERFQNLTLDELKNFLGVKRWKSDKSNFPLDWPLNIENIPENFDARVKWSNCSHIIATIRDQSSCGSCWATSSASVMSDLTCITCDGEFTPYISDEDLLSCCKECGDCEHGGEIDRAFFYWIQKGIVTGGPYGSKHGCRPYTIPPQHYLNGQHPDTPACDQKCESNYHRAYKNDLRRGQSVRGLMGEYSMQVQINQSGPIVATFKVYEDFMRNYKSGIYQCPVGQEEIGWHGAKVIGWGKENGVDYWLGVNSWGTSWGDNGFFKMKRGNNECEFENDAVGGTASPSSCFSSVSSFIRNSNPSGMVFFTLVITYLFHEILHFCLT